MPRFLFKKHAFGEGDGQHQPPQNLLHKLNFSKRFNYHDHAEFHLIQSYNVLFYQATSTVEPKPLIGDCHLIPHNIAWIIYHDNRDWYDISRGMILYLLELSRGYDSLCFISCMAILHSSYIFHQNISIYSKMLITHMMSKKFVTRALSHAIKYLRPFYVNIVVSYPGKAANIYNRI